MPYKGASSVIGEEDNYGNTNSYLCRPLAYLFLFSPNPMLIVKKLQRAMDTIMQDYRSASWLLKEKSQQI